jgi:transcriptional regulator with XRE-family HTH domain
VGILNTSKIIRMRTERGWSQVDLARAANIHPSVVSRLEREIQQDFHMSVIVAIAKALDTSFASLLGDYQIDLDNNLTDELRAVLVILKSKPVSIQRLAAGVLRGLLSVVEE